MGAYIHGVLILCGCLLSWFYGTFLCFLLSLAILSFPSLLPSSIPLPAPLLLLFPVAPTGSSTWCSWRWRKVCSTCRVEKGEHECCLCNSERFGLVILVNTVDGADQQLHRLTQYCVWAYSDDEHSSVNTTCTYSRFRLVALRFHHLGN